MELTVSAKARNITRLKRQWRFNLISCQIRALRERAAAFRSKRRSIRRRTIAAISLRSQMLYPVELRAPKRRS
jgi:hypothetical protein